MSESSFPQVVDNNTARVTAGLVASVAVVVLATSFWPLVAFLTVDFLVRVVFGPARAPLSALARQVTSRLAFRPRPTPGPPKRFAAGVGLVFTTAAWLLFVQGAPAAALVVLAVLLVFALLESVVGFCAGCAVFNLLIRVRVLPESVCVECADISGRLKAREAQLSSHTPVSS
jgi:hypothetical protein